MSWWIAGATVVAGIGSAAINADASRKASNQQADAAKASGDTALYQYERTRADLEPFRQIELQSMKDLQGKVGAGPGAFKESEGYQWTLDQGINALDKSAVAGGRSRNADTMKYAEGLASNEYDKFLTRYQNSLTPLQSLAKTNMTTQGVNANQTYATQAGNALQNAGTANAAGTINQANSITGGVNSALNNYMMWKYMNG